MYRKFVTPIYVLNMLIQSLFTLALPIGAAIGVSYLLVNHASVGGWIYALLVPISAIYGMFSMIRFIISTSRAIEALEKQNAQKRKEESKGKNEK